LLTCPTCRRHLEDESRFCPFDGTALPAQLTVGSVIDGRYRLIGELGTGATGTVYRGWQLDIGRPVAVKVLHPEHALDPELRARFRREAHAVARLSHPNIVRIHDAGESEGGCPYLVMELVAGVALDERFPEGKPVDVDRSLRLVRQVASALQDAHELGIVHRDLKLGNVLLMEPAGFGDFVKVVDFGLAKLLDESALAGSDGRLTRAGAIYGTPEYMPPEQGLGKAVDERADLYSLGVVLFRLLTGRLPYPHRGMAAVLAHLEEEVPDPRRLRPALADEVAELVMSLMAKQPGHRPASASAVVDAIDAIAGAPARTAGSEVDQRRAALARADTLEVLGAARFRHRPTAGRGRLTLLALLACVVLGGTALVAATRSPEAAARAAHSLRPARGVEPRPSAGLGSGPRRAVIASTGEGSVRILVPENVAAATPVDFAIDVWDELGQPSARIVEASLVDPSGAAIPLATRATDMPGRYRIDCELAVSGQYLLVVEVGDETSLTVQLDARDSSPRT